MLCMLAAVFMIGEVPGAMSQTLPDSTIRRVLAGAERVHVPPRPSEVALVGTPTLPLVNVLINGRGPYRLLVDLGANVTLLRRDVVEATGGRVLFDRARSDIAHVDSMAIGAVTLADITVGAYDTLDVDGVLGFNVLQHSSFTLDFVHQRLIFHHRRLPPPDGDTVFGYTLIERLPFVTLQVGAETLTVNLDTGASESLTIPPALQARLRWADPPAEGRLTHNNQTGATRVLEGRLVDPVRLGSAVLSVPAVYVNPDADHAWLGAQAMQGRMWTFDPERRRLEVRLTALPD
jgi:hypothetical protein